MCICLNRRNRWRKQCGILRCPYEVWPYFYPLLVEESHVVPCILRSCTDLIPHELLGLELRENAIGVPKHRLVQLRISVSRTSVPSICHDVWLFVGAAELGNSIVYVLRFPPSLGGLVYFFPYNIFHRDGIWRPSICPIVWVVAHRGIGKRVIVAPFV